jgi:hypothetical protein
LEHGPEEKFGLLGFVEGAFEVFTIYPIKKNE